MSWWEYVKRTAGTESPKALNEKTGIDGPTFSKWKRGQVPGVTFVSTFAKAYGRPVLEAFVAAGFLTAEEAKARPEREPDFNQLSNRELLELVRARMTEEVVGNGDHPAPNTQPDLGPVLKPRFPKVQPWEVDIASREDRPDPRKR